MDDTLFQRMRAHLEANEGRFDIPYKDSKGILTAGVGFNVGTGDDFSKLPFQVKDARTGEVRYASPAEKRAEYDRIKAMPGTKLEEDPNAFARPAPNGGLGVVIAKAAGPDGSVPSRCS